MLDTLPAILFLNHDVTKIVVDNPIILNLSLFFIFTFLTLITIRKTKDCKTQNVSCGNGSKNQRLSASRGMCH